MKKQIILVVLLSVSVLNAAIITVDNNVPSAGNYSTLQAAHDAASAGDIIYVFPSQMLYPAVTVTKPLSFYGVGFNLLETIGEPYTATASISGEMLFEASATGSHLEGFDGQFRIRIRCMNVTIKRNDLSYIYLEADACTIIQNKITSDNIAIALSDRKNHFILNNIISGVLCLYALEYHSGKNLIIKGNVIKATNSSFNEIDESLIVNNIIVSGSIWWCDNNTILYNMCNADQFPTGNGNLINVDGGFPGLPSILQIQAPNAGSQQSGLDINFKATSNKE